MTAPSSNSRRGSTGSRPSSSFDNLLAQQMRASTGEIDDGTAPAMARSRSIAARINAAIFGVSVLDDLASNSHSSPASPEQTGVPELFDEEFRARVIETVRAGLEQTARAGSDADRRQLEWFEKAVFEGTLDVQRAELVEGLNFRAGRQSAYRAHDSGGNEGSVEAWDDEFILSQIAQSRSIVIGTAGASGAGEIGHYYVSFHNPDVLLTFDQHLFQVACQQAGEP